MLAPWKTSCDQPRQHIENRDNTLPAKVHIVKAMVFPVVMYGHESWTKEGEKTILMKEGTPPPRFSAYDLQNCHSRHLELTKTKCHFPDFC